MGGEVRTIIAGSRYTRAFTEDELAKLETIRPLVTEVVSGGAMGVDTLGEEWARKHCIPIKRFPAQWGLHGRQAGPIRNRQMAGYADAAALFSGGRGTDNMFDEATAAGIRIYDWRRA